MGKNKIPEKAAKLMTAAITRMKEASASEVPLDFYNDAVELAKEATSLAPESHQVWISYAMALLCIEDRTKAWTAYRKGLKLGKGETHSISFVSRTQAVQFARMHEDNGKLDFAEEQLSLLTDHSPKFPGGWLELARFYIRHDRFNDAEFALAHGLHEADDEFLYLALSQVQALNGRLDQSIIAVKEALALKPDFFEALMYQALFARRLNLASDEKSALKKATRYLRKHPELKPAYERMLYSIENSKVLVFWKKRPEEDVTSESPEDVEPATAVSDSITDVEPVADVEPPITSTPTKSDTVIESTLRQRVLDEPKNAEGWYKLGDYLRIEEEFVEAEKCLKKATELDANHSESYRSLGMLYLSTNRVEEGDRAFRRAVFLNPSNSESWLELAKHQFETGDPTSALKSADKCVKGNPENFEAWGLLAKIHLKHKRMKPAEDAARKAIEIKISYSEGWKLLGQILDKRGKIKEAVEAFKNVVEINDTDSMGWSNLGVVYVKSKRMDDALKALLKAVEIDSGNLIAWRNLSTLYRQLNRFDDAIAANEKYLELQRIKASTSSR
ncbi:MAG: tetratricopeptide repeat protein [Candidatus Thorarchaeota archaeon]|nr:tetratricopeptide repeat protein [Candidatus Thorarchaeota archaeon]